MSQAIFEFSSSTENLAAARAFVRKFLEAEEITGAQRDLLVLGVDEACSNIMRHSYNLAPAHAISITCERMEDRLCFRLRDFGRSTDPGQFSRRSFDEVTPGGLGIHLMERIFDEINYHPKSIGTELELIKRL